MVVPLADHIIGMRQFHRLCEEQTALEISPKASFATRARQPKSIDSRLEGYAVPVDQQIRIIYDLDTREEIARYKYFSTPGGRVGGLPMLGGRYTCSAAQDKHFDSDKYRALEKQINLSYGELS